MYMLSIIGLQYPSSFLFRKRTSGEWFSRISGLMNEQIEMEMKFAIPSMIHGEWNLWTVYMGFENIHNNRQITASSSSQFIYFELYAIRKLILFFGHSNMFSHMIWNRLYIFCFFFFSAKKVHFVSAIVLIIFVVVVQVSFRFWCILSQLFSPSSIFRSSLYV